MATSLWKKTKKNLQSLVLDFWNDVLLKIWRGLNPDNLFPFLTRHFFYLIWILLVPIVLYFMAQGRELFTGLFDDTSFFSGFRASFLLIAYFAQAMAIMLLPRPFFRDVVFKKWGEVRYPEALKNPSLTYLLSTLPVIMYGLVMILVQKDRIPGWSWGLIVPTLLIVAILSARFEKKWKLGIQPTLLIIAAIIVFCGLAVSWIEKPNPFWNYFIVGTCLMMQMALIGGLSRRIAEDFREATNADEPAASTGKPRWQPYDKLYFWSTVPVVGLVIFFITCPNLEAPTPTFMLLLLTTFYMIITRLIAAWYTYRIKCAGFRCWKVWVFWAVAASFFYIIFFVKSGIHDIRTISSTMDCKDRADLDEWFEAWWAQGNFDTTGTEIPIYLVAVQGGGSRAALWTSEMLNRLEVTSNYKFHKHCFAIASASGGSVGTGATLALWRFAEENDSLVNSQPGGQSKDSLYLNFSRGAFQRNYLSGAFFEIFISEIGSRVAMWDKVRENRNYRLQKDEALGFAAGLKRGFFPEPTKLSMRIFERLRLWDRGDARMLKVDGFEVKNYPFLSYLSYWYKGPKAPKATLPLYLPISTNIQTGRAAFSSPVLMDTLVFTDAIDIQHAIEKTQKDRALSMVGATNLSELFPVMSAFTYIDKTGNFIDGGTYENMGLQVLQQIYFWLDKRRDTDPRLASVKKKIRVHVIYLINNQVETLNFPKRDRVSQVGSPIKYAGGSSIDGRTTYFTKRMQYDMRPLDTLHTLTLQAREPQEMNHRIPLGRWLSRRSVRLTHATAEQCQAKINGIVAPIR